MTYIEEAVTASSLNNQALAVPFDECLHVSWCRWKSPLTSVASSRPVLPGITGTASLVMSPAAVSSQLSESSVMAGPNTKELPRETEPLNDPDDRCPPRILGDVRSETDPNEPPWNEPLWKELPWTLMLPCRCGTGRGTALGDGTETGIERGEAEGIARGEVLVMFTEGRLRWWDDDEDCPKGLGGVAISASLSSTRVECPLCHSEAHSNRWTAQRFTLAMQ